MREILFRGKRKDNGRWTYGYLVPKETNSYADGILIIDGALNYDELDDYQPSFSIYDVVPETVGKYTGLTDKNGKKIFEGDIVKYRNNLPCKIDYIDSQFVMKWKNFYRNFEQVYDDEIEVIGNIHDNPRIVKGGRARMTVQEAIKILNPDADVIWKAYDGKDMERCNEACRVACVALEKQIPKKPDTENINRGIDVSGEYDIDSNYICPSCKSVVGDYESEDIWYNHCPECGQALDWSDNND